MSSIIKKIFHKNPSEQIKSMNVDANEDKGTILSSISSNITLPQLIVGIGQSVGIQRDHNEDALMSQISNLVSGDRHLHFGIFIVADGMGGHEDGEIASSVAVERLTSHIIRSLYLPLISTTSYKLDLSIQEIMYTGVIQAHQKIKKEALGSGTTLTAALILGDQMTIAHVGDSRAYLLNPHGNLNLLTRDHTLVKRLQEIGQITPDQASTHPQRNILYRALGQGEPFEPDIASFQLQPGSQLLLCTDGLWSVISDKEMEDIILSSSEPRQACQSLVDFANSAGGPDNISVIIVRTPD